MMRPYRHNESARSAILRRIAVYGILLLLLATAQCSFLAKLTVLPSTPDLILGAIVAISMLDSEKAASVCGVAAGFLTDALGGTGISLSPLFYLACGALCGILAGKMLHNFLSWTVNLTLAAAAKSLFTAFNIIISTSSPGLTDLIKQTLLPEFLCTVIICLPVFFIVKLCVIPLETKSKLRIDKF